MREYQRLIAFKVLVACALETREQLPTLESSPVGSGNFVCQKDEYNRNRKEIYTN